MFICSFLYVVPAIFAGKLYRNSKSHDMVKLRLSGKRVINCICEFNNVTNILRCLIGKRTYHVLVLNYSITIPMIRLLPLLFHLVHSEDV